MSNVRHETTEKEMKDIWERLTAGESSIKSAHHRIDNFEKVADSVHQLALSVSQTVTEIKALREDYVKADERIEALEEKPTKRYETFITAFITGLAGVIIGVLTNFIKG